LFSASASIFLQLELYPAVNASICIAHQQRDPFERCPHLLQITFPGILWSSLPSSRTEDFLLLCGYNEGVILCCRLSTLIRAEGLLSTKEFGSAVTVLKSLDTRPLLRDNTDLLATLGEAQFYIGDLTSARATLQRVTAYCVVTRTYAYHFDGPCYSSSVQWTTNTAKHYLIYLHCFLGDIYLFIMNFVQSTQT